jgi:hypothetical protein
MEPNGIGVVARNLVIIPEEITGRVLQADVVVIVIPELEIGAVVGVVVLDPVPDFTFGQQVPTGAMVEKEEIVQLGSKGATTNDGQSHENRYEPKCILWQHWDTP